MAINKTAVQNSSDSVRYVLIGVLVVAAFFGAYKFASASSTRSAAVSAAPGASVGQAGVAGTQAAKAAQGAGSQGSAGAAGGGCGMGCCGGGGSNAQVSGSAAVSGNVQKVTIDLTTGSYSPNKITAKAGIPLELDFKGPASGCNGRVVSQDLGFQQDVSNGGTIKVGALKPGTYTFACSMNMYTGQIVVQ